MPDDTVTMYACQVEIPGREGPDYVTYKRTLPLVADKAVAAEEVRKVRRLYGYRCNVVERLVVRRAII